MKPDALTWMTGHPRELAKYAGEWVCIHPDRGVISHGHDLADTSAKAKNQVPEELSGCLLHFIVNGTDCPWVFRVQFNSDLREEIERIAAENGGDILATRQVDRDTLEVRIAAGDNPEPCKEAFRRSEYHGRGLAVLGIDDFDPKHDYVTVTFPDVETAQLFKSWLCESGEQGFWDWEQEHLGHRTKFDYHDPGGCLVTGRRNP